jgi:hypothetical protein
MDDPTRDARGADRVNEIQNLGGGLIGRFRQFAGRNTDEFEYGMGYVPTDESVDTSQAELENAARDTAESVGSAVERARNLGPDYLDELTIGVVVLVVLGALLYLGRPLATVAANVTE